MAKATIGLSLGYWFSAYSLGLLVHPYKSVREIRRLPVYRPLLLSPLIYWLMAWAVGMVGLRFGWVILEMLNKRPAPDWLLVLLALLFWGVSWFLWLWQVMIGYLYWRFRGLTSTANDSE